MAVEGINIDTSAVKDIAVRITSHRKRIKEELKAIQKEIACIGDIWSSKAEGVMELGLMDLSTKVEAFDKDLGEYVKVLLGGAEALEAVEKAINANAEAFH